MSCFLTKQLLAQIDLLRYCQETAECKNEAYLLAEQLNEQVAKLHFPPIGTELTGLTQEQASSTGVNAESPFKSGHCC